MIRINDHKQQDLFDPWHFLSPKRRRLLDESWPGLFREHLLCELPVDQLRPFLREDFGAPSKELYTLLGVLLLQQMMDLTDTKALEQLSFNIQWHYALNITEESDSAKYISEKTLWHWRQVLIEQRLDQLIFDQISTKLAAVFNVKTGLQRIDSTHIKSNMRRLGRIGIFSHTIFKFLTNLKRHHQDLFATLNAALVDRYATKKALKAFSMVKPSASTKTLAQVSADLYELVEQFKGQRAVIGMHSYKLMQRVLAEQCSVQSDDGNQRVVVKKPKDVPTDSLQNPSDPDAAYSGHKGQGYQVQVMETFTRREDDSQEKPGLNLITHVAVEKANAQDTDALMPAIEASEQRGIKPDMVLADTLYGSDENAQKAKGAGVDLVAPVKDGDNGSAYTGMRLCDFTFDASGRVVCCPVGRRPENVRYKKKTKRFTARFDRGRCRSCPHVDACPIKPGKKYYYLWYSEKNYRLSRRRQFEASDEFVDLYRWRAGVEATMSQYKRLTGVKRLRVVRLKAVRFCAALKAAGLNILRAAAVRAEQRKSEDAKTGALRPAFMLFSIVKEPIGRWWHKFMKKLSPKSIGAYGAIKMAA
jgi:hypothetical protein